MKTITRYFVSIDEWMDGKGKDSSEQENKNIKKREEKKKLSWL